MHFIDLPNLIIGYSQLHKCRDFGIADNIHRFTLFPAPFALPRTTPLTLDVSTVEAFQQRGLIGHLATRMSYQDRHYHPSPTLCPSISQSPLVVRLIEGELPLSLFTTSGSQRQTPGNFICMPDFFCARFASPCPIMKLSGLAAQDRLPHLSLCPLVLS